MFIATHFEELLHKYSSNYDSFYREYIDVLKQELTQGTLDTHLKDNWMKYDLRYGKSSVNGQKVEMMTLHFLGSKAKRVEDELRQNQGIDIVVNEEATISVKMVSINIVGVTLYDRIFEKPTDFIVLGDPYTECVIIGTYDGIKDWYDSLEVSKENNDTRMTTIPALELFAGCKVFHKRENNNDNKPKHSN